MINKDYLVKQLKSLENRVLADKNWKREQRKLLVSQLRSQTEDIVGLETEKELNIFSYFQMILKPVVLLLVFVLGSGWLGVVASEQSLPGDLLYSIKITSEKAKVSLTFDKNKKAELHMELAQKRVGEIKELKKQESEDQKVLGKDVIEKTYNKVKEEVSEAKVALQELKDEKQTKEGADKKDKTAELVKTVEKVDSGVKNITKDLGEILSDGEDKEEQLVEEIIGGDKVLAETLEGLESLGDDLDSIVKEVVGDVESGISENTEASAAMSKIIERSASEIQDKTDKIIEDSEVVEEDGIVEEGTVEIPKEVIAPVLNELDTEVEELPVLETEEVSLLDEAALAKIETLISDENMVITLEEGKELADILNVEVIKLINNGEFDKALTYLETSKVIVEKMEVVVKETKAEDILQDSLTEESREGLSKELIVEELVAEEEVLEETVLEELSQDEVVENPVEEPVTEEESPSETN